MGITPAIIGAVGSVAGAASNLFGGSGGGSVPSTPQLPGQTADANYYNQLVQSMSNAGANQAAIYPQYQQLVGQLTNSPYAGLAQQGAVGAANITPSIASLQYQGAGQIANEVGLLQNQIGQTLSQANDPEQNLYNQLRQGTLDQANAINAQSGLANTPYGASVANNALNNFNVDWQNNLLSRMTQANQSVQGLNQAAGLDLSTASGLGTGAMSTLTSGYGQPYSTATGIANTGLSGLGQLTSGAYNTQGLNQQTIQDLASYLGLTNAFNQTALSGQQQAFNQNQILGSNLATSLSNPSLSSGLNSLFGSSSPYVYNPSTSSYYDPSTTYGAYGSAY